MSLHNSSLLTYPTELLVIIKGETIYGRVWKLNSSQVSDTYLEPRYRKKLTSVMKMEVECSSETLVYNKKTKIKTRQNENPNSYIAGPLLVAPTFRQNSKSGT